MEFTYRRECACRFPEAVEAVERSVRDHGLEVVQRYDLRAALASKGFDIQPLIILDVALPGSDASLCKVHVYAETDGVWVTAIRPTVLWQVIPPVGEISSADAEATVVALVDGAVG
jgi:uncharacterized protein (DUF302 family)